MAYSKMLNYPRNWEPVKKSLLWSPEQWVVCHSEFDRNAEAHWENLIRCQYKQAAPINTSRIIILNLQTSVPTPKVKAAGFLTEMVPDYNPFF